MKEKETKKNEVNSLFGVSLMCASLHFVFTFILSVVELLVWIVMSLLFFVSLSVCLTSVFLYG